MRLPGFAMRHRWIVLAATIIASLWGLAAFLRFLRCYPRLAGEDSDGQR